MLSESHATDAERCAERVCLELSIWDDADICSREVDQDSHDEPVIPYVIELRLEPHTDDADAYEDLASRLEAIAKLARQEAAKARKARKSPKSVMELRLENAIAYEQRKSVPAPPLSLVVDPDATEEFQR